MAEKSLARESLAKKTARAKRSRRLGWFGDMVGNESLDRRSRRALRTDPEFDCWFSANWTDACHDPPTIDAARINQIVKNPRCVFLYVTGLSAASGIDDDVSRCRRIVL